MQVNRKTVSMMLGTLLLASSTLGQTRQVPPAPVAYELINTDLSAAFNRSWYFVSVTRVPDLPRLRALLCQIVQDVKPPDYGAASLFSIAIYLNVEKHTYPPATAAEAAKQRERRVAAYTWDKNLPGKIDRIWLMMTPDGQQLTSTRYDTFNHTTDCQAAKVTK